MFSQDGKRLAVIPHWRSGGITIWDIERGEKIMSSRVGGYPAVFSPDGKTLAVTAGEKVVLLIDSFTGSELKTFNLRLGRGLLRALKFSTDGKILMTLIDERRSGVGAVILRDADSGEQIRKFKIWGFEDGVFSPDGKLLATISLGKRIRYGHSKEITLGEWQLVALDREKEKLIKEQQRLDRKNVLLRKFLPMCGGKIVKYSDFIQNPYDTNIGQCTVVVAEIFQAISQNEGLFTLIAYDYYGFKRAGDTVYIKYHRKHQLVNYEITGIARIKGLYSYLTRAGLTRKVPYLQWIDDLSQEDVQLLSR